MLFYLIILSIYFLLSQFHFVFKTKRQEGFFHFLLIIPLFVQCAFRATSVGNDTLTYYYGFDRIKNYSSLLEMVTESRYEIGYSTVTYLFSKLGFDYYFLQLVLSAFIYFSIFVFINKYSSNFYLSCFVLVTLRYSVGTMNTTRMWLAISILLYSIDYVLNKKLIPFVLIVLLASSFHFTSLIFLLLYPLSSVKLDLKKIIIVTLSSAVVLLVGRPFFIQITSLIGRYQGYLNSEYFNFEGNIAILITLAIDLSLFIFTYYCLRNESSVNSDSGISIINIQLVSALVVLSLSIIGLSNTIMARLSAYYGVFYMLSIPNSINILSNNNSKLYIKNIIMLFLFAQFIVVMIYRPNWNGVLPYHFWWE